jgi:hypothetical protein
VQSTKDWDLHFAIILKFDGFRIIKLIWSFWHNQKANNIRLYKISDIIYLKIKNSKWNFGILCSINNDVKNSLWLYFIKISNSTPSNIPKEM